MEIATCPECFMIKDLDSMYKVEEPIDIKKVKAGDLTSYYIEGKEAFSDGSYYLFCPICKKLVCVIVKDIEEVNNEWYDY